jgi:hypothetical protein
MYVLVTIGLVALDVMVAVIILSLVVMTPLTIMVPLVPVQVLAATVVIASVSRVTVGSSCITADGTYGHITSATILVAVARAGITLYKIVRYVDMAQAAKWNKIGSLDTSCYSEYCEKMSGVYL